MRQARSTHLRTRPGSLFDPTTAWLGTSQATDQLETGTLTNPWPFLQSRPIIMKLPEPFEGEHDDMDRFIGDCNAYFETFRHQFCGISSLMVVCTTSLFVKRAKDWWTHHREDFWVNDY